MASVLPISLTPSEEKAYCFRLLSLIVDGGTLVLRHRFDLAIPPNHLQNTLNDVNTRSKLHNLFKKKVLTQGQWHVLYPATGQPNSAKFDVSLLVCLLRYICGLNEVSNVWTSVPPSFDTSTEADITRLRQYRNEISHLKSISLNKQDFQRKWNKIEQVITRLGAGIPNLYQDIQRLKDDSIDPAKEHDYQEKIKEWEEMDKSLQEEIAHIQTDLQECIANVDNIKESLEDNHSRLNEVQKQTFENTNTIKIQAQKQETGISKVESLETDVLAHETKLSKVETKQTDLEEMTKKNTECFEEHQSIIYQRIQSSESKVDSIATDVCSLQSKVQELSVSETSAISSEVTRIASVTNVWLRDLERDEVYVTTHAHRTAMEKLNRTGCLILSGLPGEGKTTMATKLLSEITDQEHCLKLSEPSHWNKLTLNEEKPLIIFIDDIFGAGALNESLLEEWSRRLPDIEKAIKAQTVKAIITTRHYILKEAKEKLRHLTILKDDNVQILASYDLSNAERTEILEKHLKYAKKEFDSTLITECNQIYTSESAFISRLYDVPSDFEDFFRGNNSRHKSMIGFPEIVSLFVRNEHLFNQGAYFFGEPFLFFKKCIEELFLDEEKFLALILVWASHEKKLKRKDVEPPDTSDEIKMAASKFGINLEHKTTKTLRKSLKYHEDGFLRFDPYNGTYYFSHNSVKDMVGLVAGQEYTSAVLEFADNEFLKQFVTTDETKNDGLHIYVEQFRYKELHLAICRALAPKVLSEGEFKKGDGQIEKKFGFGLYRTYEKKNEISMNTSVLKHDCFSNNDFVSQFCKSEEGKYMFSKPVDALPKMCLDRNCDIDLGEEITVYLPSLGLLYDSSLLLKEVFKQNLHQCINTTEFLQSTLLIASHEGLKDVIEMLLQHSATVNEDAIYFAAAKGHSGSLEYLLKNYTGNCIDCPNSINKNSPLIAASKYGAVECMKCLLRHGASINYRNKNGWSALDKAVLYRQPDSCKLLLENKARVNCKAGKFKRTPLHMNADVGDENITKLLLQHGASIKAKDYRGHYPIHCAAFSGENKIVDILLKADETKVTLKNRISYGKASVIKGASLYHVAVWKKNVDLIDILIQNKLCPNIRDAYGRTPLYLAVYGRENKKDENDERYTMQRAQLERELQIKVIKKLSVHSDVHISEKDGYTPLHAAVHKGQIEIVKLLGPIADVNAQDKYGKTPLHTACDQMNLDIFKILVEDLRADYCMRTKSGRTIFDILAIKTEWRYVRRRYQNGKSVTKYMIEYPRFKSFRAIIAVKDPDFLKQVLWNIDTSDTIEPNKRRSINMWMMINEMRGNEDVDEGEQAEEKENVHQGEQAEENENVHQGEQAEEYGNVHQGEQAEEKENVHQGEQAEENENVHQGEQAEEYGNVHQGEHAEENENEYQGKQAEEHGNAHQGEQA
ncbi:uncharacterized protein LOC123525886 [Mercenaria mercenaria]|uniref:uncharacterized protein LOC123525886 n=1 Tax=Mercenaria mercenaria TaxID=6596 RepID=UPI00234F5A8E|nr:uncharacterized protein LOC123525886 [Mercenaria mercenaria]